MLLVRRQGNRALAETAGEGSKKPPIAPKRNYRSNGNSIEKGVRRGYSKLSGGECSDV